MKWLIAVGVMLVSSSFCRADSLSAKERIWRSSYTSDVALTDVAISTLASTFLGGILNSTPQANAGIYFYDSRVLNQSFSTKTYIALDRIPQSFPIVEFSSGMIYRKIGTNPITIFWDYHVRPFTE